VTIAAALCKDDEHGFLRPSHHRERFKSADIQFSIHGNEIKGAKVRKTHDFRDQGEDALSIRGWTLQERLFARRLITYASAVTFECKETSTCECGHGLYPNPLQPSVEKMQVVDRRHFRRLLDKDIISKSDRDELYNYWFYYIVQNYCNRRLSKDSDRLPAIAALAMVRIPRIELISEKKNQFRLL
jgi:hypothetical protein